MIRSGISVIFALALIMNATIVFNSQVSTATALNKPITSTLTAKTSNFQKIRFTHGVGSGDVSQHSAVLWTRINQEGLLTLDISTRPDFKGPDFKKSNIPALEENDFAVKVTVTGLEPNHQYFYRWSSGKIISEIGLFKTAPTTASPTNIHFSWSGDSDVTIINGKPVFGNWKSLFSALLERPNFFIYLGDTIYSQDRAGSVSGIPDPRAPDAETLDEYRQLYKGSRNVPALHALLQRVPIYASWDDHEVRSDWAGQTVDPFFYNIGNKAFREYMPIGEDQTAETNSGCAGPTQFRVFHWGKEADVIIIDTRSCRSANAQVACGGDLAPTLPDPIRKQLAEFFPNPVPAGCLDAINNPTRTMLGITQKAMFKEALAHSTAKYKFVISSVSMQQLYVLPYEGWEGYAAERKEILNFIQDNHIENVIFLTTDQHINTMNEVSIDHFTNLKPIAFEFITGPIAALTDEQRILKVFGPDRGPLAIKAKQDLLETVVGVDCLNLNEFSYGSVDVNSRTGMAKVTLKDDTGKTIHDQLNPQISCTKTFGES